MKRIITFFLFTLTVICVQAQSVGIGSNSGNPHASSILDISSNSKGVLFPRMTSAQRNAISAPATGLLVFDTDSKTVWCYSGTQWTNTSGGVLSLPFAGSVDITTPALSVTNSGTAIEGHASWGTGVYATSATGTGLNVLSSSGFGILATSVQGTAIYAFQNNALPTINASNTYGQGVAISANSPNHHAVLATSGGTSKAALRGEASGASGAGVYGMATHATGNGVYGYANNGGTAVKAQSPLNGYALDAFGNIRIAGGNTNPSSGAVLTSDASGNARWENNRIAFKATGSGGYNDFTLWQKVEFTTEHYDYGNGFIPTGSTGNSNTSKYTVPVKGLYHFDVNLETCWNLEGYEYGAMDLKMERNGQTMVLMSHSEAPNATSDVLTTTFSMSGSVDHEMLVGDKVWVEAKVNTIDDNADCLSTSTGSSFNGRLIFRN